MAHNGTIMGFPETWRDRKWPFRHRGQQTGRQKNMMGQTNILKVQLWKLTLTCTSDPNRPTMRRIIWNWHKLVLQTLSDPKGGQTINQCTTAKWLTTHNGAVVWCAIVRRCIFFTDRCLSADLQSAILIILYTGMPACSIEDRLGMPVGGGGEQLYLQDATWDLERVIVLSVLVLVYPGCPGARAMNEF